MTSETKKFIEPRDVIGLSLHCVKCRATILLPLSKEIFINKLYGCPHCGMPWLRSLQGGSIETTVVDCIGKLTELKELLAGEHFSGLRLALEVKIDEEPREAAHK